MDLAAPILPAPGRRCTRGDPRPLPGVASLAVLALAAAALLAFTARPALAQQAVGLAGKRILWIDSYHEDFEWSRGIGEGMRAALEGSGVAVHAFHMDTKNNPSEEAGQDAGLRARQLILATSPDLVIASDDAAQRYLVVPYLKGCATPVVFCGVNWDSSMYGYPAPNITGMIEVNLVTQLVEQLRRFARGERLGYLSGEVEVERKILGYYNSRFFNQALRGYLVSDFEQFKAAYLRAQEETDMLLVGNYGGIAGWNATQAQRFMTENAHVPSGCFDAYMSPCVLYTMSKSPREQGEWAARSALRILAGTRPEDIPIVENSRVDLVVNMVMADALRLTIPAYIIKTAELIRPAQER